MTFSIVARSDDGESWGVAVASKFLAVGAMVPAAVAGIGAIATQADANVAHKARALAHLDDGATAGVALQRLLDEDPGREHRQVGIVDASGTAATHTGGACFEWAGGLVGEGFAVQGNVLTGPDVLSAMQAAWQAAAGDSFPERLLTALRAGDEAGGDRRGRQSAALLVVRDEAGYGGHDDVAIDLRVDDHADPVTELARLLALHQLHRGVPTAEERVEVTPDLAAEISGRTARLGHPDLWSWAGTENVEMRVDPAGRWIDRRVLAVLREAST